MSDEEKLAYKVYNGAEIRDHTPPRRSSAQVARAVGTGIVQEVLIVGMAIAAYLMIMMSGLSFAEETVMGFHLEMWHALVFAIGYTLITTVMLASDAKTPLAYVARMAAAIVTGLVRTAFPAIVLVMGIIWVMALPDGVINIGSGFIAWFGIIALSGFAGGDF